MNRLQRHYIKLAQALVGVVLLSVIVAVQAKTPFSAAEAEDHRQALITSVAKGDALWHSPKLATNGLACANCHPDGSASNPHTFPKFQSNLGKVGTLREMINWCIAVPMLGMPLPMDSDDLIAMEAYATFMHRGVAIAPGKDEQHGAVLVKSGPGYPTDDGGDR